MKLKCHNSFLYDTDPPYPPQSACVNEITPDMPPAYILAAMSDSAIPVEQSLELFDVYKAAGVEVHVGKAEGAPHAFTEVTYFWPEGCDWWEGVILPALEWAKDKAWA
jgi:acetyl esterase/lipase